MDSFSEHLLSVRDDFGTLGEGEFISELIWDFLTFTVGCVRAGISVPVLWGVWVNWPPRSATPNHSRGASKKKSPLFCAWLVYIVHCSHVIWGFWLQIWIQNLQILSCIENKKFEGFPKWLSKGGSSPQPFWGGQSIGKKPTYFKSL